MLCRIVVDCAVVVCVVLSCAVLCCVVMHCVAWSWSGLHLVALYCDIEMY